jgi:hypothetical protein
VLELVIDCEAETLRQQRGCIELRLGTQRPAGGSKFGLTVVSIKPPARWTPVQ